MVVPQIAEIKTVPVCNRSIHCNTEHEARRRKTVMRLSRYSDPSTRPHRIRNSAHRVPHTHTTDTSHTSPTSFSLSFSPVPLPQPSSQRPHRGAMGRGAGRGCLDSAYAHTLTHSLTHRALASDCAIWASRELYTKTITRSLSSVVCTFRTAL